MKTKLYFDLVLGNQGNFLISFYEEFVSLEKKMKIHCDQNMLDCFSS